MIKNPAAHTPPLANTKVLSQSELKSGAHLKQYELLEIIGSGGQTVVWSAIESNSKQIVAIKIRETTDKFNPESDLHEFQRNTQTIANLQHPHIVPIINFGASGYLRYLVSPYLPAGSLEDLLHIVKIPFPEALRLFDEITSALAYIHQQNIVHRDIKSSNVLIDYRRRAYVADFGLARVLSDSTVALHTGQGTPPYASPEQHSAATLSPRSDIYSFGILVYEILTQHLPWKGEKSLGVQQLVNADEQLPDPRELNPNIPARLVEVLRQFTAADVDARPQSMAEVQALLHQALPEIKSTQSIQSTPSEDNAFNAREILRHSVKLWTQNSQAKLPMRLTDFVLVNSADTIANRAAQADPVEHNIMLYSALMYRRYVEEWWQYTPDTQARFETCAKVIGLGDEAAIQNAVHQLTKIYTSSARGHRVSAASAAPVIEIILQKQNDDLIHKTLATAQKIISPSDSWNEVGFTPEIDSQLAALALSESVAAAEAAQLIGRVGSERAIQIILDSSDTTHLIPTLRLIHQAANDLPMLVPALIRWRIIIGLLWSQLAAEPLELLKAYTITALGGFLSFGLYTYFAYELPNFMDAQRIGIAIIRGAYMGVLMGLGLFASRVIVERLTTSIITRILTGAVITSVTLIFSIHSYYGLFLDNLPLGWVIPLGCIQIALGVSTSIGITQHKWLQALLITLVHATVFGASWIIYLFIETQRPLVFFNNTWSPQGIFMLILIMSLPLGIFSSVFRLTIKPKAH